MWMPGESADLAGPEEKKSAPHEWDALILPILAPHCYFDTSIFFTNGLPSTSRR